MKIAYCLNSIRYLGGIQRVTIVKANALASIPGNEVYVIVTDNKKGEIMGVLDEKVHLIDLDINYYKDDWKSKLHLIKGLVLKRRKHLKKLKKELYRIQPDIVISIGQSEKNMVPRIKGKWKTIREFHFVGDYRKRHATNIFQKYLAWGGDFIDQHFTLKKYDQIVVLTEEDKELNWDGWRNVCVIPNPTSFHSAQKSQLNNPIVVSTGRLSPPKNYISLVNSFGIVGKRHTSWQLVIYGKGEEKDMLERRIRELGMEKQIILAGYCDNIQNILCNASIAAYTSLHEGFPLSIIEAMECGLPVVSYSCPCGPRNIIEDGKDGFLIDIGDENEMANKICILIEDEKKRNEMGMNAIEKAQKFHIDNIVNEWMKLFTNLTTS